MASPLLSSALASGLLNVAVGMFGLCSVLLGLFWGFTQFIVRSSRMSDYDRRLFLDTSNRITGRLVVAAVLLIGSAIGYSLEAAAISAGDSFSWADFSNQWVLAFEATLIFFAGGVGLTLSVFPLIIRSIGFLSERG